MPPPKRSGRAHPCPCWWKAKVVNQEEGLGAARRLVVQANGHTLVIVHVLGSVKWSDAAPAPCRLRGQGECNEKDCRTRPQAMPLASWVAARHLWVPVIYLGIIHPQADHGVRRLCPLAHQQRPMRIRLPGKHQNAFPRQYQRGIPVDQAVVHSLVIAVIGSKCCHEKRPAGRPRIGRPAGRSKQRYFSAADAGSASVSRIGPGCPRSPHCGSSP